MKFFKGLIFLRIFIKMQEIKIAKNDVIITPKIGFIDVPVILNLDKHKSIIGWIRYIAKLSLLIRFIILLFNNWKSFIIKIFIIPIDINITLGLKYS